MIDYDATDPMGDEHLFVGDPVPLRRSVPVPPFPVDCLPDVYAEMVKTVSEATQTDPAMAGTTALAALSACTGGHAVVTIRHGWSEPLNLYSATVANPAERKSAVQQLMAAPLYAAERALAEASRAARVEAETTREVAGREYARRAQEAARINTNDSASDEEKASARAEALAARTMLDQIVVPEVPRLIADDVTPEAVGSLLAAHGGRLAIISAEGGIFDIIAGRYTKQPNYDVWLKGHAGDPLKVDRQSREPQYVERPALTVALMIQPAVVGTIAGRRDFRGRGLTARFLYARPDSWLGHRLIPAPAVNAQVQEAYAAALQTLASNLAGWSGDPAVLQLTPDAHAAVVAIEKAVEPTLIGDGELAALPDWGGKYVGAVVRIAGNLHFGIHGAEGFRHPIEADTVNSAAQVGEYFKACAINTFSEMGTDEATADAVYLLDRVARLDRDEVSERDIYMATRSRFRTVTDMRPALTRVVDHGWLIPLPVKEPTEKGRPASPRYKVVVVQP